MAKTKGVTVTLDIKKIIEKRFWNAKLIKEVGQTLKEETIRMTQRGISPVRGKGRFVNYKDPSKYPGKKKPKRPVNLTLKGTMLKDLDFTLINNKLKFGIFGDALELSKKKATTHNNGSQKGRVPIRRFIPNRPGEEFAVSIMRKIIAIYRKRISAIIRQSK